MSVKKLLSVFSVVLVFFIGNPDLVLAEEETNTVPFEVTAEQSDKQVDTAKSYFDLKLDPSEETTLRILINNKLDSDLQLEIDVEPAKTNSQGVIEYGNYKGKLSKKAPFNIAKQVSYEKAVSLSPKESKTIELKLKAPEQPFEGIMVAGINIHQKVSEAKEAQQGMAIKNRLGYQIAMVLHGTDNYTYAMEQPKVSVSQLNYRNAFIVSLDNQSNNFLDKALVESKVRKKGEKKYLYTNKNKSTKIAPYSVFDFPVFLNEQEFTPGTYVVDTTVNYEEYDWKFSNEVTVTKEAAKKYNAEDVTIKEEKTNWKWIIILSSIIILLLGAFLIVFYRLKKNQK